MVISYNYRNMEYLPSTIFGFKIHVSATFQNYKLILKKVRPYLETNKIAYKFVDNEEEVYKIFSVFESSAEAGKLVTIYPSPTMLNNVLEDLYALLPQKEDGIYILSDRPYKDSSLLFYRFGLFQDVANVYQDGIPTITTIEGETWQDYPKPYFDLPTWIDDIQPPQKETNESYLRKHYKVNAIIHQSSGGNIYLGETLKDQQQIILKESRPHILSFYNVEKKELRKKEYDLALKLKNLNVKQVPLPIESVDEWINSYYIYSYVSGESLTDFCKNYGINAYSRKHKTKNLRLFNKFIDIVDELIKTIIYFHSKEFVLNDIHPDNFIVNKKNELSFIDLENSYLYGDKPFVGIESKISLKSWNFLDGKQADLHKLGNMIIFLLARLSVSDSSLIEVQLLDKLLKSYGINSNLPDFVSYLLSETVSIKGVKKWLGNITAQPIIIDESLPQKPITSIQLSFVEKVEQTCLEFKKYKKYLTGSENIPISNEDAIIRMMNSEYNLGLNGLSGVIILLKHYGLKRIADEGVTILLGRLEDTDEGKLVPIEGGYYSPYICNGLSGVIQMLYYMDKEKYRQLILDLRKSLCVEFAQYENYSKGMLGIADTLLLTTYYRNSNNLHQCIQSLILNSYLYHKQRKLPLSEFKEVLSHYYNVYSL